MKLRLSYEDLDLVGFDAGGGEIMYYRGRPFTGISVDYGINGQVLTEQEFTDGHLGGVQREYYLNGQMSEEYFVAYNTDYGIYRQWDREGNLTSERNLGTKPQYHDGWRGRLARIMRIFK